jgi:hypothetical protein
VCTAAKLARAAGVAPIPASSGNTQRHRLDQGGNRQINAALHRVIVTRARCHTPTRDYIARRRSEGKSTREATAASSATSSATPGDSFSRPTRSKERRPTLQLLDRDATAAAMHCVTDAATRRPLTWFRRGRSSPRRADGA